MKGRRRRWENLDISLLAAVLAVMVCGYINLRSSSAATGYPYAARQLQWYGMGVVAMAAALLYDYRRLLSWALPLYLGTLGLLGLVLVVGRTIAGSRRWLSIGVAHIQPSELAKLAMIVVLATYFYRDEREVYRLRDLVRPFLLTLVPALLVYKEPDLGTSILIMAILGAMVYCAGLNWKSFLILVGLFISALPLGWTLLKPYQKARILTFLEPERDPFGAGYHLLQSKIAVGSGGLLGKGYMAGSQAHLQFLPEVHTDFAFSIWCEEWGFVGALFLLLLYAWIIYRGLLIAARARDRFGGFLAFGVVSLLFFHCVINICMVLGLMPVVGVPLPLFSYGGSAVFTTLLGVGLLLNVGWRRFLFRGK